MRAVPKISLYRTASFSVYRKYYTAEHFHPRSTILMWYANGPESLSHGKCFRKMFENASPQKSCVLKTCALQHFLQLLRPHFQRIAIAPVKTAILCTQDTKIFCYVLWIGTCITISHTSAQLHRPGYIVKWSSASHDYHMPITCRSTCLDASFWCLLLVGHTPSSSSSSSSSAYWESVQDLEGEIRVIYNHYTMSMYNHYTIISFKNY